MTRARALQAARILFVVLTLACAWWGFRGRWQEIGGSAVATGPWRMTGAVACALVGLALTGALWRMLLRALGPSIPARAAASIFFVGQLGKYVPGSVWSFAVQAQMGRRWGVPVRSSLTASSLFLLIHTSSGVLLGSALVAGGVLETDLAPGWWLLIAAGAVLALTPPVLRFIGDKLAGADVHTQVTTRDVIGCLLLMGGVWLSYGASLWMLVPGSSGGRPDLGATVATFALAHAAGVLLVLAPAGLGAREAVVIALLAPVIGVPAAAAAALLSRVAHSLADFLIAVAASALVSGRRTPEPVSVGNG